MNITLRRKIYFTLVLFLISFTLTSCTKSISEDNGIIEVKSIDPSDKDFSDLMPLKKFIGDSTRVVMLGEASHGDGQAFLAKTRLIEFLHEEMGFDVLAFESNMYDVWKSNEFIKDGKPVKEELEFSIYSMWSYSQEFIPLIKYIEDSYKTESPVEIAGIDLREKNKYAEFYFEEDLNKLFNLINSGELSKDEIILFKEVIMWINLGYLEGLNGDAIRSFSNISFKIDKILSELILYSSDIKRKRFYLFWKQFTNLIQERARYISVNDVNKITEESFNIGDHIMGENIIWLCNELYPDKKIIVWAHNIHVSKNYNQIDFDGYKADFFTMGSNVYESLGNKCYSIGFVSYGGKTRDVYNYELYDIPIPRKDSFEDLLSKNNYNYLYLDFKSDKNETLKKNIRASIANYGEGRANWNNIFDGIFYIKEMKPSIY